MFNGVGGHEPHFRYGSLILLVPAITTIPILPGLLDCMIQTTVIKRAKDISLSLSLKRVACFVHQSPLFLLLFNFDHVEMRLPSRKNDRGGGLFPSEIPSDHREST